MGPLCGSVILAGLAQTLVGLTDLWLGRLVSHPTASLATMFLSSFSEVGEDVEMHMYFPKSSHMVMLRVKWKGY